MDTTYNLFLILIKSWGDINLFFFRFTEVAVLISNLQN